MINEKPPLDPQPLSPYVAWAGNRNREPILKVLKNKLPKDSGKVLELATGSGMHINFFAPYFKHLSFYPTDKDIDVFDNIKTLRKQHNNANVCDPEQIDLSDSESIAHAGEPNTFSAIICINIFQVAPIHIAAGMMRCAADLLTKNGFLLIYGPFQIEGKCTTDSNQKFHDTLKSTGVTEWGLKDVADLKSIAAKYGLFLKEQIDMPTNNFSLIFGKT